MTLTPSPLVYSGAMQSECGKKIDQVQPTESVCRIGFIINRQIFGGKLSWYRENELILQMYEASL